MLKNRIKNRKIKRSLLFILGLNHRFGRADKLHLVQKRSNAGIILKKSRFASILEEPVIFFDQLKKEHFHRFLSAVLH